MHGVSLCGYNSQFSFYYYITCIHINTYTTEGSFVSVAVCACQWKGTGPEGAWLVICVRSRSLSIYLDFSSINVLCGCVCSRNKALGSDLATVCVSCRKCNRLYLGEGYKRGRGLTGKQGCEFIAGRRGLETRKMDNNAEFTNTKTAISEFR